MSSLLELAADFLDRMTNPAFGADANEEYTLRFSALLSGDAGERLRSEAAQLQSADALTPHAWAWLLRWAKSNQVPLGGPLLVDLCERWESAAFKAIVIDAGTGRRAARGRNVGVADFPDPWLRTVLVRATRPTSTEDTHDHDSPLRVSSRHSRHAQSLLMALLLVETDVTLDAASSLLREDWHGRNDLLRYFWGRADALDPETREVWRERLDPPERPPDLDR